MTMTHKCLLNQYSLYFYDKYSDWLQSLLPQIQTFTAKISQAITHPPPPSLRNSFVKKEFSFGQISSQEQLESAIILPIYPHYLLFLPPPPPSMVTNLLCLVLGKQLNQKLLHNVIIKTQQ